MCRLSASAFSVGAGVRRRLLELLRSVIQAWFVQYGPALLEVLGEEQTISSMDEMMQELLKLASGDSARAESYMTTVEERLAEVVNANRSGSAAHVGAERELVDRVRLDAVVPSGA